jgi:hypothetical protein
MAYEDDTARAHGDFQHHSFGSSMEQNHSLSAYSEDDDDVVTVAMQPLEEQLPSPPAPDVRWRQPVPMKTVVLPAPPIARPPSVRPAAGAPVRYVAVAPNAPPEPIAPVRAIPPSFLPESVAPVRAVPPLVQSEPAQLARAVVPRAQTDTAAPIRQGTARPHSSVDLLETLLATTLCAGIVMMLTFAALYRFGAFEPGSVDRSSTTRSAH